MNVKTKTAPAPAATDTSAKQNSLMHIIADESENVKSAESDEHLIIVRQLPIIDEQLARIKERFQQETEEARKLECTNETRKLVKERRALLTKVFTALETQRKEVKRAILAPYEAFEKVYKECVTDIYKPCDEELARKISEVENSLKTQTFQDAADFFKEYCLSKNINFLKLEDAKINITLNTSKKKIREEITAFVDRVSYDLAVISNRSDYTEVLVEYKRTLKLNLAIVTVEERHKAMSLEQRQNEEREIMRAKADEAIKKINEAFSTPSEPGIITPPFTEEIQQQKLSAPDEIAAVPETAEALPQGLPAASGVPKMYVTAFKVRGTIEQLKALKQFMNEGGIKYEQLQ